MYAAPQLISLWRKVLRQIERQWQNSEEQWRQEIRRESGIPTPQAHAHRYVKRLVDGTLLK